ncbi:MAG: hypothetical protein IJD75_03835 [Clostridia bacterium]|nr:hypothetical protein [Clostridia bacterium]
MKSEKKKISIGDRATYFYIKNLKKWMFCPSCKNGKMSFNKKTSNWVCEDCGYGFSEEYFLDDCVFWFCDECETYLNNQEGFDKNASKHICRNCGYENDTAFDNIKGICSDCGKLLPNPDATLCADCREARREKAKQWLKVATGIAVVVGSAVVAASATEDNENTDYTPLPNDNSDDDNEVYGLGEGIYPTCKTCGAKMTKFDGWAWYTCPECEDKVRIIEGKETWHDEIFNKGKKQHKSDFELADFCRGGDLTED